MNATITPHNYGRFARKLIYGLAVSMVLALGLGTARVEAASLGTSIEPAFRGQLAKITIDGHGFDVRPVFGPQARVTRTQTSLKVENYFRHRIAGKDDRVHYLIEAERGKPYRAKLVKIEYRGIGKNEVVQFGAEVAGAIKGAGGPKGAIAVGIEGILRSAGAVQRWLNGKKWELAAAKVIDALGARLPRQL